MQTNQILLAEMGVVKQAAVGEEANCNRWGLAGSQIW